MTPGRFRGRSGAGRSTWGLLASLLAISALAAALLPFLIFRSPVAEPPAEASAAARLAQSLAAELRILPVTSPLLSLPAGERAFTYHDPAPPVAFARRPTGFRREWLVEGIRFDSASGRWVDAPGGSRRDGLRITIRIRKALPAKETVLSEEEAGDPVLARVVLYRALSEAPW